MYDSSDPQLVAERSAARRLLRRFNHDLDYDDAPGRLELLTSLLGSLDASAPPFFEPPLYVDYGYNISVGSGFYANFGTTILDINRVTIGDRVLLGPNVHIYTVNHPLSPEERAVPQGCPELGKPVVIEDDCWIGGNVTILPGVTIKRGSTVAAGAVVTRDVPERSLAAGNPAKVVRKI